MTLIAPISDRAGISGDAAPRAAVPAALFIAFLFVVFAVFFDDALAQPAPDRPVLLIDIKGAIGFVAVEQLTKALGRAASQDSPVLVVRLDTPGGLVSATREMIHAILASRVPVVMYVAP